MTPSRAHTPSTLHRNANKAKQVAVSTWQPGECKNLSLSMHWYHHPNTSILHTLANEEDAPRKRKANQK